MAKNNYNRRKRIKYPKPSELLAEFIGIFIGDGSFRNKYQISISYNHRCEGDYAKYIQDIVQKLFGLKSKIRIRKKYGSAEVVITSSNLVEYIRKATGITGGNSREQLKMLPWVSKDKNCRIGFLRGLFDSEGCIYQHKYYSNSKPYSYIKIAVTNYCNAVLLIFHGFLKSLKIRSVKYRNRIHIYRDTDARKFFVLIGSNNNKNRLRFKTFSS